MRVAATFFGLLLITACGESQSDTRSAADVLIAANAAKDRAMVVGDAAALDNFYTADYEVIDDKGDIHDKRSQVQFMTETIDLIEAESTDVKVSMLGKNAALVTGRMRGVYREGGREKPFDERYTSIWLTEDSQWRVRHEHSSMMGRTS